MNLMDMDTYDRYPQLQIPGEVVVDIAKPEKYAIEDLQGRQPPAPMVIVVSTTATGITFTGWEFRIIRFVKIEPSGNAVKYDGGSEATCWDPDISYTEMKALGMIG